MTRLKQITSSCALEYFDIIWVERRVTFNDQHSDKNFDTHDTRFEDVR